MSLDVWTYLNLINDREIVIIHRINQQPTVVFSFQRCNLDLRTIGSNCESTKKWLRSTIWCILIWFRAIWFISIWFRSAYLLALCSSASNLSKVTTSIIIQWFRRTRWSMIICALLTADFRIFVETYFVESHIITLLRNSYLVAYC